MFMSEAPLFKPWPYSCVSASRCMCMCQVGCDGRALTAEQAKGIRHVRAEQQEVRRRGIGKEGKSEAIKGQRNEGDGI